jgi:hypothetical protein
MRSKRRKPVDYWENIVSKRVFIRLNLFIDFELVKIFQKGEMRHLFGNFMTA